MAAIGNWFVLGYASLVAVSIALLVWMSRDDAAGLHRAHRRSRCDEGSGSR